MAPRARWKELFGSLKGRRRISVVSDHMYKFTVISIDRTKDTAAELHRMVGNSIKDAVQIGWRAANDCQDLARRCLLFQSCAEITVSCLKFLEQARVLDRDHGLVSERFKKSELLLCKRADLLPTDMNRTDRRSFA